MVTEARRANPRLGRITVAVLFRSLGEFTVAPYSDCFSSAYAPAYAILKVLTSCELVFRMSDSTVGPNFKTVAGYADRFRVVTC